MVVPTSNCPLEWMFDKHIQRMNRFGCAETDVKDGGGSYNTSCMPYVATGKTVIALVKN